MITCVAEVLKATGRDMVLRKVTRGTYTPGSGMAADTTEDYSFRGAITRFKTERIDNTTILSTDKQCTLSAKGIDVEPDPKDLVIDNDITYQIISVEELREKNIIVGYICQLRV